MARRVVLLFSFVICISGCSTWNRLTNAEKGAVIGGGSGVAIGSEVGGTPGALIGGAGGAAVGAIIGDDMDKDDRRRRRD